MKQFLLRKPRLDLSNHGRSLGGIAPNGADQFDKRLLLEHIEGSFIEFFGEQQEVAVSVQYQPQIRELPPRFVNGACHIRIIIAEQFKLGHRANNQRYIMGGIDPDIRKYSCSTDKGPKAMHSVAFDEMKIKKIHFPPN